MRLLLDTHAFLWFVLGDRRLPRRSIAAITAAEERVLSAMSGYEIALKHAAGRLPDAGALARDVGGAAAASGMLLLPVTLAHAEVAGRPPRHHRDPFDRLLAAQSLLEGLPLVSAEPAFDALGIARVWSGG
jgi:PIN domain nuclease of toxin-antitoxin system